MSYIWQNKKRTELSWDKNQVESAYNRYLYQADNDSRDPAIRECFQTYNRCKQKPFPAYIGKADELALSDL